MDDVFTPSAAAPVVRAAVLRLARRLRVERNQTALSNNKIAVLSHLAREGASTPTRISEDERQQPQSLTRPFSELQAAGLIERQPDAGDGRRSTLRLTPAGRAAFDSDMQVRDEWLRDALASLSAEQLTIVVHAARILQRLGSVGH